VHSESITFANGINTYSEIQVLDQLVLSIFQKVAGTSKVEATSSSEQEE
jgi:hypothetical protein